MKVPFARASGNENKLPTRASGPACTQEIRWLNPIICGASRPPSDDEHEIFGRLFRLKMSLASLFEKRHSPKICKRTLFPVLPGRLMANEAVMNDPGRLLTNAATTGKFHVLLPPSLLELKSCCATNCTVRSFAALK